MHVYMETLKKVKFRSMMLKKFLLRVQAWSKRKHYESAVVCWGVLCLFIGVIPKLNVSKSR